MKSNTMSLTALRKKNNREGYRRDNPPINLQEALAWTRAHMIDLIRISKYQTTINYFQDV